MNNFEQWHYNNIKQKPKQPENKTSVGNILKEMT